MSVNIKPAFIKEVCQYLADNSGGRFTFGSGANNLKLGDLAKDVDGVYCVQSISPEPDRYLPINDYVLDFWAVNRNASTAYDDLQYVYELFHQNISVITSTFQGYYSHALSQIEDMDRDEQGRKMFKLSVRFITRNLIS